MLPEKKISNTQKIKNAKKLFLIEISGMSDYTQLNTVYSKYCKEYTPGLSNAQCLLLANWFKSRIQARYHKPVYV